MIVEVRPIRTKRDYEAALREVERLWGAKAGTSDGDRLDVLATLIDAYEAQHYPMDPPDPVEAIKFRMEQQGLTRRDLEQIIWHPHPYRRGSESKTWTVHRDDPSPARAPRHFRGCADPPEPKKGGVTRRPHDLG
jgi:antitoxin component HigA of HigAB toxin-antitoxin module